jgi:hypothetical protein
MAANGHLVLFFRPLWLVPFGIAALVLALVDVASDSGLRSWTWLVIAAGALPPFGALMTIGALRCGGFWKYFVRKIGNSCPKCSRYGSPYYRCPHCSHLIEKLVPSLYGIFAFPCVECGVLLPTTERMGRSELKKVCAHCSADLVHEDLGKLPEYRIGVIGAASSGKTNLMVTTVWQLVSEFAPYNDIEVSLGNPAEEAVYRQYVEWLEKGLVMPKTVALPIPRAFTLSIKSPDGTGCLLYLYDAAGEDYQDEQRLSNHPLDLYDGLLFVVDPFAEEGARRGFLGANQAEVMGTNPAAVEASEIFGRLVAVLERVLKIPVGGFFPFPLAVVMTKIDACGLSERLRLGPDRMKGAHLSLSMASNTAERYAPRVRDFLIALGLGNLVRLLESRFGRVSYFPVSSLGKAIDKSGRVAFTPYGALGPLVWLCYQMDALSDRDSFERVFINFNVAFIRSLRGFEGELARMIAWGALVLIAALVFVAIKTIPPFLLWLVGGIQFVAIAIMYLCLIYDLIRRRYRD